MLILDLENLVFSKDNVYIMCICLSKHMAHTLNTIVGVGSSKDEIWSCIH
jgi:hypothetical protein